MIIEQKLAKPMKNVDGLRETGGLFIGFKR